jgi:RNA ligase
MPKYNTYSYIFPPRPKNACDPKDINKWDNKMMIAQPKMNGSNCVIFMNDEYCYVMNRHNQRLTNFQLSKSELSELYKPVDKGNWLVINGEYLNKSKNDETGLVFNHKFIIFDILVFNSDYLVGQTFEQRVKLLDNLYGQKKSEKDYLYQITENIYRVKSYDTNFNQIFNELTKIDMVEGIVCKRKSARLELGTTEGNNTKSQIKFRKPTKSYRY